MNTNEITYNELSAGDITPDLGQINILSYPNYTDDKEICFKLNVWELQCKYGILAIKYANGLMYGIQCGISLDSLKTFKIGLEVLNRYDPRDIVADTVLHNSITYSTIQKILQKLYKQY
jgi:hypothetical protein